jgi:hypothetical protein
MELVFRKAWRISLDPERLILYAYIYMYYGAEENIELRYGECI